MADRGVKPKLIKPQFLLRRDQISMRQSTKRQSGLSFFFQREKYGTASLNDLQTKAAIIFPPSTNRSIKLMCFMGPPFLDHFTSTGVISQRCSTALKLNHVKKTPVGDMAIREALPFALLLICSSSRLKVESLFLKIPIMHLGYLFFLWNAFSILKQRL